MAKKVHNLSRRDFFKIAGAAGVGSVATTVGGSSEATNKKSKLNISSLPQVPTRPFGKTGVNVSALAFGGSHNFLNKMILLKQAVKMGITYWDTANNYAGGNSEAAKDSAIVEKSGLTLGNIAGSGDYHRSSEHRVRSEPDQFPNSSCES